MTPAQTALAALDLAEDGLLASALGWKVASWRRALRESLSQLPGSLEGRKLLEVGTGAFGLNLLFARLGCDVVCTDRRLDYMRQAIALHQRFGISCQHLLTDARRLALRPQTFDLVVMKSVLGGIYSQAGREGALAALGAAREVLKPGGLLIALEQLQGGPVTRVLRRVRYPERRWHYFRVEEFTPHSPESLMDGFEQVSIRPVTLLSHNVEEWLPHSHPLVRAATAVDRVTERWVPPNWKHLVAVVARTAEDPTDNGRPIAMSR